MLKILVKILKRAEILSAISCRLVQLTGKSKALIHPKHLIKQEAPFYYQYFKKSSVVLDLGCHMGEHSFKVARLVKKVLAVDNNLELLQHAKLEQKRNQIKNVKFSYLDAEQPFSYKDGSFDLVLFLDVLEHLSQREQAMREINRILNKDGLIIMAAPNKNTSWKKLQRKVGLFYYSDPDHKIEFSRKQLINLCQRSGFKIISVLPIAYDTPLAPFIDLVGGVSLRLYKLLRQWKDEMAKKYPDECAGFLVVIRK